MQDKIDKVRKFHEVFLIGNEDAPVANVEEETYLLRHRLMHEENEEYLQACKDGDLVEIADALGDLLYIWCGSVLKHGLQDVMEDVFNEIQSLGQNSTKRTVVILDPKRKGGRPVNFDFTLSEEDIDRIKIIKSSIEESINHVEFEYGFNPDEFKKFMVPPFITSPKIDGSQYFVLNTKKIKIPDNADQKIHILKDILNSYLVTAQLQHLYGQSHLGGATEVMSMHDPSSIFPESFSHYDTQSYLSSQEPYSIYTPTLKDISIDQDHLMKCLIINDYLCVIYYLNTFDKFFENPLQKFKFLFDVTGNEFDNEYNKQMYMVFDDLSKDYLEKHELLKNPNFGYFIKSMGYNNIEFSGTYLNYDELLILFLVNEYHSHVQNFDHSDPDAFGKKVTNLFFKKKGKKPLKRSGKRSIFRVGGSSKLSKKKKRKNKVKKGKKASNKKKVKRVAKRKYSHKKRNKKK